MDPRKEQEIEARLSSIESTLAALQRSIDELIGERRSSATSAAGPHQREHSSSSHAARAASRARATPVDDLGATISEWFSSRSPEWWLSRLGMGFVVIAILFLYSYAIERGWITPLLRVLAGALVGTALFWAATKTDETKQTEAYGLGLRQVLYGGALAIWYVTAYAASVWYNIISIPSARLLFFVLTIVSAWISLQERREIFAFIAVTTGFATPFILYSPVTSLTPFALYLGAVTAVGLFIYLVHGWPSTIWITFLAFWLLLNGTAISGGQIRSAASGAIAISVLLILAGAAFTRVPSLRRQLLATGSKRYTPAPVSEATQRVMEGLDALSKSLGGGKSAADSLALWVMTLLSPVLAVSSLANIWVSIPAEGSGLILIGLGSAALYYGMSTFADRELRQVVFTAAALWTLLGLLKVAPSPEWLAVAGLFAAVVLVYIRKALIGPRTIAKATIVITLAVIAGHELSGVQSGLLRWRWIAADVVALGASAIISRTLVVDRAERLQGAVLAVLTYLTSLVVILNILAPVWPPLVTATYAVFGAVLLVMSRRRGGERLLRQLGGVTMLIVVARLFFADLASVETVWRVLLFLVIGAVFLYAAYRLQPARATEAGK
ncbi:MAG TPA: DUF2339 domain-containing protein [Gemmatimonadaceae bacterium]